MTDTQKQLAQVWASILPNRTARMFVPESNFFDEGGHSILAQQMFFRLRQEWKGIDLPVRVIFQSQTLKALAAEIDATQDPTGLRLDTLPAPPVENLADEAYAEDARTLAASQVPKTFQSAKGIDSGSAYTALLTGATGFLGSYLLHELLEGPYKAARVIAHVRAKDASAGLSRVQGISQAYGLWRPEWLADKRLEVVVGDISRTELGVSQDTWARLGSEVDVIVHNGAQVNWMLPYSSLRAANVLSTLSCIRLCAIGKAKRLAFVSSTSTLDSPHYISLSQDKGLAISETDDLEGSRKGLGTGYGQSKWASEHIVREAGRRGLVGAVIRPGYVTGDPTTGVSITDDFLVRLWKGCLQLGARPSISNTVNTVPVNQVSRIVVASALHLSAVTGASLAVAQVTSHPRLTLDQWMGALDMYGYSAPAIPYADWCDRMNDYVSDSAKEEHALLPLFHFVTGNLPADTIAPEMDDANATAALKLYSGEADPMAASAVTAETIGVYFAYLVAAGFLPPPQKAGARSLPPLQASVAELVRRGAAAGVGGRSAKP